MKNQSICQYLYLQELNKKKLNTITKSSSSPEEELGAMQKWACRITITQYVSFITSFSCDNISALLSIYSLYYQYLLNILCNMCKSVVY